MCLSNTSYYIGGINLGINLNVDTNNENEFNQQLQMYLAQGYSIQSNFNGTAILKKKSYSVGVLIILIIFFFPAAIIYYLLASDDVVTIRNNNGQPANNNTTESFDSFCEECGQGLFKDSKFCPGCGRDLSAVEDEPIDMGTEETLPAVGNEIIKCKNCGTQLSEEHRFCPQCGEQITDGDE